MWKSTALYILQLWSHILVIPMPLALIIAFQLWSYRFFVLYTDWTMFEIAFYAFWHRLVSALCICIIIIALSVGSQLGMVY